MLERFVGFCVRAAGCVGLVGFGQAALYCYYHCGYLVFFLRTLQCYYSTIATISNVFTLVVFRFKRFKTMVSQLFLVELFGPGQGRNRARGIQIGEQTENPPDPTPEAYNPTHPKPQTLNPKPETLKPSTLNPQPDSPAALSSNH